MRKSLLQQPGNGKGVDYISNGAEAKDADGLRFTESIGA